MARKGTQKSTPPKERSKDKAKDPPSKKTEVPAPTEPIPKRRTPSSGWPPPGINPEGMRVGIGIALLGLLLTLFVSFSVMGDAGQRYAAAQVPESASATLSTGDLVYVRDGEPAPCDLSVCTTDIFSYPTICTIVNVTGEGYYVRHNAGAAENVTHLAPPRVKGAIDMARTVKGTTVANYALIAAFGIILSIVGLGMVMIKGLEKEE